MWPKRMRVIIFESRNKTAIYLVKPWNKTNLHPSIEKNTHLLYLQNMIWLLKIWHWNLDAVILPFKFSCFIKLLHNTTQILPFQCMFRLGLSFLWNVLKTVSPLPFFYLLTFRLTWKDYYKDTETLHHSFMYSVYWSN